MSSNQHGDKKTVDLSPEEFLKTARANEGSRTVVVGSACIVDGGEGIQGQIIAQKSVLDLNNKRYEVTGFLGSGSNGGVVLAELVDEGRQIDPVEVVIKYSFEGCEEALEREARYMRKLNHPSVVRLFDHGSVELVVAGKENDERKRLDILIGERLFDNPYKHYEKPLPPALAIDTYVNLLRALDDIHCAKFIHGDVKPDNILLRPNRQLRRATKRFVAVEKDDDEQSYRDRSYSHMVCHAEYQPVFGDLGCAIDTSEKILSNYGASPAYLSPESMLEGRMGPPRDVYALTASFVEMLTGIVPYAGNARGVQNLMSLMNKGTPPFDVERVIDRVFDRLATSEAAQNDKVYFTAIEKINADLKRIIPKGLEPNPKKRASTFELVSDCVSAFDIRSSQYTDYEGKQRKRWTQSVLPRLEPDDSFFKRRK